MRYVVCDRVGLSRFPEGPLASFIVSFANSMESKGYSVHSLRHQVRLVAGFSQWLARSGVELHRVCSEHASQYLRYRARRVRAGRADSAALRHLLEFLHHSERVAFRDNGYGSRAESAELTASLAIGKYVDRLERYFQAFEKLFHSHAAGTSRLPKNAVFRRCGLHLFYLFVGVGD